MKKINDFSFQPYLESGKKYFKQGDYSSAIEQYDKILKRDSQNKQALFEAGKTYYVMENYPEAKDFLNRALKVEPCNEYARILLAKIYYLQEDFAQAIKELKGIIEESPENCEVHFELGIVYYKKKLYELAGKELRQAIRLGFENEDVHLQLCNIYLDDGKYSSSLSEFKKVLNYSQDDTDSRWQLNQFLERLCIKIREEGISSKDFNRVMQSIEEPFFKNRMLNEWEIYNRKVILESKPRGLLVTLTTRCNARCSMCDVWKDSWDIPEKTVKEIIALFPYLEKVVWQGGEVFLSEYFDELIYEARKFSHLRQSISTNGLLINEEWAEKLLTSNVDLIFSIDGVNKEIYEKIRTGSKFEDLLNNISIFNRCRKKFPDTKVETTINVVLMKSNLHQLSSFPDFANEYGFDILRLNPIERILGPENIFLSKDKKALDYIQKTLPEVSRKCREYNVPLINSLPLPRNEVEEVVEDESGTELCREDVQDRGLLCCLPWQSLLIEDGGKVVPHCFCLRTYMGNVCENSIEEIWNSEIAQLYRKKIVEDKYHDICNPRCSSDVTPREYLRI